MENIRVELSEHHRYFTGIALPKQESSWNVFSQYQVTL